MSTRRTTRAHRTAPRACAAAVALALSAASATSRADDVDDFLIARDNFVAGEFAQSAVQLRRLVGVEPVAVRAELIEPARKYYAAALFSMGQRAQAEQVIEAILRDNPDAALSPVLFSPPLQSLFYDTRQRMLPILNAIRDQRRDTRVQQQARRIAQTTLLRELATRESVVVHQSRWSALLPLGIPQFFNGQTSAGAGFLSAELAFAGIALSAVALCPSLVRDVSGRLPLYAGMGCTETMEGFPESPTLTALKVINVAGWTGLGATIVGGIIHGFVTIRTERREVRARPAPPGFEQIQIAVAPMVGAPGLSLIGRF